MRLTPRQTKKELFVWHGHLFTPSEKKAITVLANKEFEKPVAARRTAEDLIREMRTQKGSTKKTKQ